MLRQIDYPTRIVILSELREPIEDSDPVGKDLSLQCANDLPLAHPYQAHCVPAPPPP